MYKYLLDYAEKTDNVVCEVAFGSGPEMRRFIKQNVDSEFYELNKFDCINFPNGSVVRFTTYPSEMSSRGVMRDTLLVCGITDERILGNLKQRTSSYYIEQK